MFNIKLEEKSYKMSFKALPVKIQQGQKTNRGGIWVKVRTLQVLFAQVINKHLRMNTSENLESLTEMPQHFW